MPNPMMGLLYTSADMEEDLSITLEPIEQCRQMGGQFGVVIDEHCIESKSKCLWNETIVKHLMLKWIIIMKVWNTELMSHSNVLLELLFLNLILNFLKRIFMAM